MRICRQGAADGPGLCSRPAAAGPSPSSPDRQALRPPLTISSQLGGGRYLVTPLVRVRDRYRPLEEGRSCQSRAEG